MKTFAIISEDTGRRFSFNAQNVSEANDKLSDWKLYHGFRNGGFSVEETTETLDLHNEFVA